MNKYSKPYKHGYDKIYSIYTFNNNCEFFFFFCTCSCILFDFKIFTLSFERIEWFVIRNVEIWDLVWYLILSAILFRFFFVPLEKNFFVRKNNNGESWWWKKERIYVGRQIWHNRWQKDQLLLSSISKDLPFFSV